MALSKEIIFSVFIGLITGTAASLHLYDKLIYVLKKRTTWGRVVKGVREIMNEIRRDEYKPDVIIGAGRAGAIIAGILSGNLLKTKIPLYCIDFSFEWEQEKRIIKIDAPQILIKGKKVLVVVGEVHTGDTLRAICSNLKQFGPAEIRTVSLFESGVEMFKPNYYIYKISGKQKMPWHLEKNYEKKSFPET